MAQSEHKGLEQRGTDGHGVGRSVRVPTSSIDVDSVDPSGPNTMAYQHFSNQGIAMVPVVDVLTLPLRAALVHHTLCEPDAPVHDLGLHQGNIDGA